jgi:hypothetical protein
MAVPVNKAMLLDVVPIQHSNGFLFEVSICTASRSQTLVCRGTSSIHFSIIHVGEQCIMQDGMLELLVFVGMCCRMCNWKVYFYYWNTKSCGCDVFYRPGMNLPISEEV